MPDRLRIPRFAALVLALLSLSAPAPGHASARTVTGLAAELRAGQVFVTWDDLPSPGLRYRVYRGSQPITSRASLAGATLLATVRDSSAVDRCRTRVMGLLQTFRVDSAAAPLAPATGLFVHTPETSGLACFAVLAESAGVILDSTLVPGANTLASPIAEWPEAPLPVWQRRTQVPADGDDYVLWVHDTETPALPVMANRPSTATHLTLKRGLPGRPLVLHGHSRGGNSYQGLLGSSYPGESILCIEDHLPTADYSGFAFGYVQDYDPDVYWNGVRLPGGIVMDYVEQRIRYVLDWAQRVLDHDPKRLYAWGGSMGGSMAFFLGFHHPERVAATFGVIPKLCTGYTPDSYLALRESFDRIWGRLEHTPMGSNALPVFDWMDGRWLAEHRRGPGAPPMSLFFGRRDTIVGWPEKVAYAQAMQAHRIGGALFWDTRRHFDNQNTTPWAPTQTARRMHAFRLDRSFPALSRCTADGDMGDGSPESGDSLGTINGHVDWDTSLVDLPDLWMCTLRTVSLTHRDGVLPAPDSAQVDVTPRRLQQFLVAIGAPYAYEVNDVLSGQRLAAGTVFADSDGLLTVPQVPVRPTGTRLTLSHPTTRTLANTAPREAPAIRLGANPVRGSARLSVRWPAALPVQVRLLDASGRLVRLLHSGEADPETQLVVPAAGLAPGLYWIDARQGEAHASRRLVVLR